MVMGVRRTIMAHTDANGEYSTVFEPLATESGYYVVNSGREGNYSMAEHDSFNIPGLAILNQDTKMCLVDQGWSVTDSVLIRNKSNLPMNNITLTKMSNIEGCTVTADPLSLAGLDADYLVYTISGSTLTEGNLYQELKLKATSAEGADAQFMVWYYCKPAQSDLDIYPSSLTANMTKGKSKIVDVMLVNGGTAETGTVSIDLPDVPWMSMVGNDTLSSIAVNDTAYFSLRLSPANNISLVQYTGTIVVHSERGDDIVFPYTIDAVSESTGSILIDATDEYTYNTNGGNGPHLEGAHVTIIGYYSLELVAEGYTDSNGHFSVNNLPEGWYRVRVSADKHSEYNNTVQVFAGAQMNVDAFMTYQAVTYSWDVVPTEIEDEYTFELVVTFETNVPKPVITIDNTATHELEYGETDNFSLIITNHGLITSYDLGISFDDNDEYVITPLYDFSDSLPALTTIVVPCQYTRIASRNIRGECSTKAYTVSYYFCNNEKQWQQSESKEVVHNVCNTPPDDVPEGQISETPAPGYGYGVGTASSGSGYGAPGTTPTSDKSCTPCSTAFKYILVDVLKCIPFAGKIPDVAKKAKCAGNMVAGSISGLVEGGGMKAVAGNGLGAANCYVGAIGKGVAGATPGFGYMLCLHSYLTHLVKWSDCHKGVATPRGDDLSFVLTNMAQTSPLNYLMNYVIIENMVNLVKVSSNLIGLFKEPAWTEEENAEAFLDELSNLLDNSADGIISPIDAEILASSFIGTSVTHDDIIAVINRLNKSISYWEQGIKKVEDVPEGWDDDFWEYYEDISNDWNEAQTFYNEVAKPYAMSLSGGKDLFPKDDEGETGNPFIDDLQGALEYAEEMMNKEESNSVCAKVTVKFSQKMTMTREAFEGTFSVHNGNEENSIQHINLDLVIKDKATGEDCTSLFQINTKSLNNITSIGGYGSLGAGLDGSAIIQFIPTKNAAPTEPKIYSFGGTFRFTDPYTHEDVDFDLYPVDITVNPSPDLYVDYFMQRDILGDDALTTDKIEPSIPAELGVRIHNKG